MLYRLEGVRVRLGTDPIIEDADFQHNTGEHLVLVGRNGAGKTTLLRLLAGEIEAEHGRVRSARRLDVARLNQRFAAEPGTTAMEYALGAFHRLHALEEELRRTTEVLEKRPDDPDLMQRLQQLQEHLERSDVYRSESETRSVLAGFGLDESCRRRPVESLSGGQRTRLALARALLEPADLLLLDEPTNHLDLFGARALADRLRDYPGAFLVATHDRDLIDRVAHDIVEIAAGRLKRWPAPYEKYRTAKATAEASQLAAWQRQREEIEKTQDFIRKNIVGQKTRQAQARRKQLERMERLERPPSAEPTPSFVWRDVERSGDVAVAVEGADLGHGDTTVLHDVDLVVRRSDRVAVIGANGAGKTTLLKALAGRLPPRSGRVVLGHKVVPGWYDQELAELPPDGTVLDVLWDAHPTWKPKQVHGWAARFGFSGDDVDLPISGLSGGENGRLLLARVLASSPNLLLLDEPTNHLDLPTCEALEDALLSFPGTVVLVTHDRRLLQRVATRTLVIADGRVEEALSLAAALDPDAVAPSRSRDVGGGGGPRRSPLAEEQQRLKRDVDRLQREVAELESRVEARHDVIARGKKAMADRAVWSDPDELTRLQAEIDQAQDGLDDLEARWAEAADDLEALTARLAEIEAELKR